MKRFLSLLVTLSLLFCCFSATAHADAAADIQSSLAKIEEKTGLTFPLEEPVTLRIMVNRQTTDTSEYMNQLPQYKIVEEMTNIHIEWLCVPSTGWAERKNLVFASGDTAPSTR